MSLKSFFRKKHKYETQADLQNMTVEQILNINPSDIGLYIETETGGVPLNGVKKRALYNLLAYKRASKEMGPNRELRLSQIDSFLKREGIKNDPQVSALLVQTDKDVTGDRVTQKQLENRLRRLRGDPEIPYTTEEDMFIRTQMLRTGGRRETRDRRKRVSRRRFREKTKKTKNYKKNYKKTHKRKHF